ncbi:hypothetical protein HK405_012987, partial [Cladochytrium tenue]
MQSAADFLTFVRASPSPFHAVAEARARLDAAGFVRLSERAAASFAVARGGLYYFTRNHSSIVAFAVGGKYAPGNGFSVVGAHTDSPCLKLKPVSSSESVGYAKVGVELYGGGLWHTWFDRDLGVAGRVILNKAAAAATEGGQGATAAAPLQHRLVRIDEPILRIPSLAIHLDRTANEGFKFNSETQLAPILGSAEKALNVESSSAKARHAPLLVRKVAEKLGVDAGEVGDFELCLFDTQPPAIGGVADEYIFSARLDNLMSSYCAITALIDSVSGASSSLAADPNVRVVALFDNEEVGSTTAHGANSNLLESALKRLAFAELKDGPAVAESPRKLSRSSIATSLSSLSSEWVDVSRPPSVSQSATTSPSLPANEIAATTRTLSLATFEQALTRSLLISADMAHAVHPNYAEKHESNHRPAINKGIVIKQNAQQRYATTAVTMGILREIARRHNVPLQE